MTKKENVLDPNSCLNKAADDEPIFILRAKDPCTVPAIQLWIAERVDGGWDTIDSPKIQSAFQFIKKVEQWQHDNPYRLKKLPKPNQSSDATGSSNDDHREKSEG